MTTARDIYKMEILEEEQHYFGKAGNVLFRRSSIGEHVEFMNLKNNEKLVRKVHIEIDIDYIRGVQVSSFCFEDVPFAIVGTAGRDYRDDDFCIVTDYDTYNKAVNYLVSLDMPNQQATDMDKDLARLEYFYGYRITPTGIEYAAMDEISDEFEDEYPEEEDYFNE